MSSFYASMHGTLTILARLYPSIERFRQETEKLIGTAYSTIMASTCGEMLNSPEDKLTEVCERLGWVVEAGVPSVIIPKKPPIDNAAQTSCEEQMKKLTEFVSFLES